MNPPRARLTIRDGVPETSVIDLVNLKHELGRWPHSDIGLDNPHVSRRHAEIEFTGTEFVIRDLGSSNGTLVNGTVVDDTPRTIRSGDIIEFGKGQVISVFSAAISGTRIPPVIPPVTPQDTAEKQPISQKGLFVDIGAREVYVDGELVDPPCGRKQFDILSMMYERRGDACSKDSIAAAGWSERLDGGVTDGEIGAMIFRLRHRIGRKFIETVPGYGYKLNVDA